MTAQRIATAVSDGGSRRAVRRILHGVCFAVSAEVDLPSGRVSGPIRPLQSPNESLLAALEAKLPDGWRIEPWPGRA